jgi:hypothetical protein
MGMGMTNIECTGSDTDGLVDQVTKAMMHVNEHTAGFTYSQLMREMAIVAVAICGKGTAPSSQLPNGER